jgi:hypothetical protein
VSRYAFFLTVRTNGAMTSPRIAIVFTLAAIVLAAFTEPGPAAAPSKAPRMVYVRGPAEPDCDFEMNRAKARNDAAALFLAEFKCKVQAGWKCAATCKADELLVTHIAVRVGADGKPAEPQVVQKCDSADFERLSLNAIKAGAPYPAPPAALVDAGGAPLKIEFVCDCAQKPQPAK